MCHLQNSTFSYRWADILQIETLQGLLAIAVKQFIPMNELTLLLPLTASSPLKATRKEIRISLEVYCLSIPIPYRPTREKMRIKAV